MQTVSRAALAVATIAAVAGLASSASAAIGPSSVRLWTGQDYGAGAGNVPGALNKPGDAGPTTWVWNQNSMSSQPQIDAAGRVWFQGSFAATPQINSVSANNNAGIFHATNSADVALLGAWATGQLDPTTGLPMVSNSGTVTGVSTSSLFRVSGTSAAFGVRIGNPGAAPQTIFESTSGGNLQNNTLMYHGGVGGQNFVSRTGEAITTLPGNNDWTMAATNTGLGNIQTNLQSLSGQFLGSNASGTLLVGGSLATAGPNPATAPVNSGASATAGNNSFLATTTAGGSYNVIARGGDLPFGAGGPQFRSGNNGVGGFFSRINANGQVAYDANFFVPTGTGAPPAPGGASSTTDSTAWIHTPGAGNRDAQNVQFYQEGVNVPVHVDPATGVTTSNGSATYSGSASFALRSFSNAGVFYSVTPSSGDTTSDNNQMLMVSTAAGGSTPTWMIRKNDIAPGFTAASGVRLGAVSSSNMAINNAGDVAFAATLQGNVIADVSPEFTVTFPPPGIPRQGPPLITPGVMGNSEAIFTGRPGITGSTGLRALARSGDFAPGFGGLHYKIEPSSSGSVSLNNNGDLVFKSRVVNTGAGEQFTANGWQLQTGSSFPDQLGFDALFGYSAGLDQVIPLLYVGQEIEVSAGVFKYITQFSYNNTDDGNGAALGFNDAGQVVTWVRLADTFGGSNTSTAYIVLAVPAPGAGMLGLLGLGAVARRRRR